jgi:hypothetical protein
MWDKTVGTMRHLAERNPFFKPVYESAQQNIDDVSMLANDAADHGAAHPASSRQHGRHPGQEPQALYLLLTTRPWPALCLRAP